MFLNLPYVYGIDLLQIHNKISGVSWHFTVFAFYTVVSLSFIFFFLPRVFISNQKSLKKKPQW